MTITSCLVIESSPSYWDVSSCHPGKLEAWARSPAMSWGASPLCGRYGWGWWWHASVWPLTSPPKVSAPEGLPLDPRCQYGGAKV